MIRWEEFCMFVCFFVVYKPIQHGRGGHWALVVRRRVSDNFSFGLFFGCFGRFVFRTVSVTSTQDSPLAITFRACYQKSAGPADAAGAFITIVTIPEIMRYFVGMIPQLSVCLSNRTGGGITAL